MIDDTMTSDPDTTEFRLEPELRKALEAILLVIDEPVGIEVLAQVLEVPDDDVEDALLALAAEYVEQGRGFVLRRAGGGWRLYTDPGAADYVERFVLHGRSGKLTQAALETLAIIAYKQPVTRADISEIRGVDADSGVRNLMARGLVEEVGRADTPGQPLLYGTTVSFLEKLGVDDLGELPALPALIPDGPPPPEPKPGGYKAARKELNALAQDGGDDDGSAPAPGARLTALLSDAEDAAEQAGQAGDELAAMSSRSTLDLDIVDDADAIKAANASMKAVDAAMASLDEPDEPDEPAEGTTDHTTDDTTDQTTGDRADVSTDGETA